MRNSLFLLIALLASLLMTASSQHCYGYSHLKSLVKKGEPCGGAIPCEWGSYCDNFGVCSAFKATGASCRQNEECGDGSVCFGTTEANQKCRVYGNPGDACTSNDQCGTNYCGPSEKCGNGRFGDGCKNNEDCGSLLVCSGGSCKASTAVGDSCPCSFGQYCNAGVCAAGKKTGECFSNGDCAPGYRCVEKSFKDEAPMECVKRRSRAAGEWCYDNESVCAKGLCHRGHCIEKSPVSCGDCVLGEICTCEDGILNSGHGVCKEDGCATLLDSYNECNYLKCDSNTLSYSKSCANRLCRAELDAYYACDTVRLDFLFNSPT